MARKKGGLNPEVQDDGGLFGDQMLVYEDDLKKAEETPARKKSAGGRVAKASAEAPVQTPLLPEVEESVEVQAPCRSPPSSRPTCPKPCAFSDEKRT